MSRCYSKALPVFFALMIWSASSPLTAQEQPASGEPSITAEEVFENARDAYATTGDEQKCPPSVTGEIIVCAPVEDPEKYRIRNRKEAEDDYARRTMNEGANAPPDPCVGPNCGIFTGPATMGGMCGLNKCPPPPAIMIDLKALPEAPPGSDADRAAQGLPPLGEGARGTEPAPPAPNPPR